MPRDVLLPIGAKRRIDRSSLLECDVFLARLATRQCGVVGRQQLVALGFERNEIDHRVTTRRLIRIHQGVYAVGHEALSDRGRMIAALIAAGPGAALSHQTAAYLWKLISSTPPFIHITCTDRRPRNRLGIVVHEAKRLETTKRDGMTVTTPLQTIAQLRGEQAARARDEALVLKLIPHSADDHAEPTRSEIERLLLRALARAGLPRPLVNHIVEGHMVDFFWPAHGLVVETDGWLAHRHRTAFETDRARDVALQATGLTVTRFTGRQVRDGTMKVIVQIGQLLARTPHHASDTPPPGG